MSKTRIGYEFSPLPRRWYAGWAAHQGFYARGLRDALFEFADGGPIPIHGPDWLASVCNQLQVHGKDRPNVRRALKAFVADGLLGFDGAVVRGRFLPDADPVPHRAETTPDRLRIESGSTPDRVEVRSKSGQSHPLPLESTPCNDSTLISQTEEREETEETSSCVRAPARETVDVVVALRPPVQTPTSMANIGARRIFEATTRTFSAATTKHREQLHEIGLKPAAEWAQAAAVLRAASAKAGNVANMLTPEHILANWHWYSQGQEPPTAASIAAERAQRRAVPATPAATTAAYRYVE